MTMFGLDVYTHRTLRSPVKSQPEPTGRALDLDFAPEAPERLGFPADARAISDEREADGGLVIQIEHDESAGYLISGPRYGATLLRPDARAAAGRPGAGGFGSWLRLLVAQVLPFAAILRGLEAMHASAVAVGEQAIALAGRPGAGKSTTAAALRRAGAVFLTDDVLALESRDGELIAHPGAPFRTAPDDREELVPVDSVGDATSLDAVFLLDRRADGPPEPRFEPTPDPRLLIATTFNTVLRSPARQRTLLEVCGGIAERRVERIAAGPGVEPDRVAAAILEQAERSR
jgi:hypothetical protein